MRTTEEAIHLMRNFDFKSASQKEIESILPNFGMNDEEIDESPPEFKQYMGWGVKFWQYPNQFSHLLCFLKDKQIESYLELGVRWGGTFIIMNEFLRQSNPHLESYANDFIERSEILSIYQNTLTKGFFSYLEMTSKSGLLYYQLSANIYKPQPQIDLVFIDGCHLYWCVKDDYLTALNLGAKYIVFHDIVSQSNKSTRLAWEDIKKKHRKTYEFTEQYPSVKGRFMGIGVIEVTKEDDIFPFYKEQYQNFF